MKLEICNFYVKDIQFGSRTFYKNGILTVNTEEAAKVLNPDGKLKNIEFHVARPGESVRLLPVRGILEARARPDGRALYPGYTGHVAPCGDGIICALKNMCVTVIGKYAGMLDGILDMTGPGAKLNQYSKLIHLAFTAENVDPAENKGQWKSNVDYIKAHFLLAEYLGKTVLDQTPDAREFYELTDVSDKHLPRVAYMNLWCDTYDTPYYNDLYYGVDLMGSLPSWIHPNELLDGCLMYQAGGDASGGAQNYSVQNHPLIKRLYAAHGTDIEFVGVIMRGCAMDEEGKRRQAMLTVKLAKMLKLDAVIFSQQGGGHNGVDFFLTIAALEDAGIKTVGLCSENAGRDGRTQSVLLTEPKATAIVATGTNADTVELPPMDRIIGDLESVIRDPYPGAWADDPVLGPSLRPDGSIIVDRYIIVDHDGILGWSTKTVKDF